MQGTTQPGTGANRSFVERIVAAFKLDASVYEEVEHDPDSMKQAAAVIALAALAQGLGAVAQGGLGGLVSAVIGGFIGWAVSAAVIWLIGVQLMGYTSDYPELLRTTGFASVPQFLMVLGLLPLGPLRGLLALAVFVLLVISFVVAVRQALDVDTGRAVLVCIAAVVAQAAVIFLLVYLMVGLAGGPAPGPAPSVG
jgi:hypothetical protein